MSWILTLIGKLGGRKWLAGWLGGFLLPMLPMWVAPEYATMVIGGIAGIIISFIGAQGYADGNSNGVTSTTPKANK